MGWLRDLMVGAPDAPDSFGELARRLLSSPDWPGSTRMRERSLSALFSKLDRGDGLEWLIDRPSIQHLIAEMLCCSVSEVRTAIGATPPPSAAGSRLVRLRALQRSKTLDLLDEALFPGLPPEVTSPESWRALWWHAPQGAGRSLVGQWLHMRRRARLDPIAHSGDGHAAPLFLELHARAHLPQSLPDGPFCIAAPFQAPSSWSDLQVVESPPIGEYLHELLSWVAQRLPSTADFDVAWTKHWLSSPEYGALVDTPGTVLDLCGVLDELGRDRMATLSPRELCTYWLTTRVRVALDREDPVGSRLTDEGLELLIGMVRRALVESEDAWDTPRDFDTWRALVPEEFQREADIEWLQWSLARTTPSIRPRDVRRAARQIPPGAFRALRALTQSGVLSAVSAHSELLALTPRWLGNFAHLEAERTLARGSALGWGEVLLKPGSEHLHEAVAARLRDEPTLAIESALEQDAVHEPAYASAIEALVVHSGLALLASQDFRPDAMSELLEEQLSLSVELSDGPPAPRAWPSWPTGDRAFHGLWLLSVITLSEDSFPNAYRDTYFDMWHATRLPRHWRAALDLVAHAVAVHSAEPWVPAAFGVVDRLRRAVASVAADGLGWHALERPGLFVEEAQHGALTWHTVLELGADSASLRAIRWLATCLPESGSIVATAAWRAWCEAGGPCTRGTMLSPDLEESAPFWAECPTEALDLLVSRGEPVALERLAFCHWQHSANSLAHGLPSVLDEPSAWGALPDSLVDTLFTQRGALSDNAWRGLWRHDPARASAATLSVAEGAPSRAALITALAPPSASPSALAVLERLRLVDIDRSARDPVRAWLHARVRRRDPEWRRAHALLFELDHALAALPNDRASDEPTKARDWKPEWPIVK